MKGIKGKRAEMGVTQVQLAALAGMDPATLNRIEQGKANPNLKTIERLADALEVEVADFFPKVQASLFPESGEGAAARTTVTDWLNLVEGLARDWREELDNPSLALERAARISERASDAFLHQLGEYTEWNAYSGYFGEGELDRLIAVEKALDSVSDIANNRVKVMAEKQGEPDGRRFLDEVAERRERKKAFREATGRRANA